MDSKKYNNIKLAFSIGEGIATFVLVFVFVQSGLSTSLENYLSSFFSNQYLLFLSFVIVTGIASAILFSPVSYYTGFYLEHKYNLSNQILFGSCHE